MNSPTKAQNEIKTGVELTQMTPETLNYAVTNPLGKAFYKSSGRPKKTEKAKWNDRIKCEICGTEFIRSNRSAHNKTKAHKIYSDMNQKLKKMLLSN